MHLTKDQIINFLLQKNIIERVNNDQYYFTKIGNLIFTPPSLSFEDVIVEPRFNKIPSRSLVDLSTKLTKNTSIPTPLVCANMECVINADFAIKLWRNGVTPTLHRFYKNQDIYIKEIKKVYDSNTLTIVSVGVMSEYFDLIRKCVDIGVKIFVIDIAHGYSEICKEFAQKIKKEYKDIELIIGNVCNAGSIEFFADIADAIKVGIGNGSVCQTQIKTGSGGGQITSVLETARTAKKYGIPIISDGGINESGDVVKALVAGADSVMCGKIFARCPESAGEIIEEDGKKYKIYYGMASNILKNKIYGDKKKYVASEGIAIKIPIGAPIEEFVNEFLAAIRSGFTYCGASNINELHQNGTLRIITKNSYFKGIPHALFDNEVFKISN